MYAPVTEYVDMRGVDKVDAAGFSQAIPFKEQHHRLVNKM